MLCAGVYVCWRVGDASCVSVPCPGACRVVVCFVRGRVVCWCVFFRGRVVRWCVLSAGVSCLGVWCLPACRVLVCGVRAAFGRVCFVACPGEGAWCSGYVFLSHGVRGACVCCLLHGVRGAWVCRMVFWGRVSLHVVRGTCDCCVVYRRRVIVAWRSCCAREFCLSHRVRGRVFLVWCPWASLSRGVFCPVGVRCVAFGRHLASGDVLRFLL